MLEQQLHALDKRSVRTVQQVLHREATTRKQILIPQK